MACKLQFTDSDVVLGLCLRSSTLDHYKQVPELAASMGLSTAPQLRFLKRQGKEAKSVVANEQQETLVQPAAGVRIATTWTQTLRGSAMAAFGWRQSDRQCN